MIFTLPFTRGAAFFQLRVPLDGTDYLLDFSWNARAGAWFVSLATGEGVALVSGVKVVSNRSLFARFAYLDGMPPGALVAADPTLRISYPGYDQLGTSEVPLIYADAEELAGE